MIQLHCNKGYKYFNKGVFAVNKHLRNILGAIRSNTIPQANKAKAQGSLNILTDYTKPTTTTLLGLYSRVGFDDRLKIEKAIRWLYTIEAETENYIRSATYETEIKKGN